MEPVKDEEFQQNLNQISCGDIDIFRKTTDTFLQQISSATETALHEQEFTTTRK